MKEKCIVSLKIFLKFCFFWSTWLDVLATVSPWKCAKKMNTKMVNLYKSFVILILYVNEIFLFLYCKIIFCTRGLYVDMKWFFLFTLFSNGKGGEGYKNEKWENRKTNCKHLYYFIWFHFERFSFYCFQISIWYLF